MQKFRFESKAQKGSFDVCQVLGIYGALLLQNEKKFC